MKYKYKWRESPVVEWHIRFTVSSDFLIKKKLKIDYLQLLFLKQIFIYATETLKEIFKIQHVLKLNNVDYFLIATYLFHISLFF